MKSVITKFVFAYVLDKTEEVVLINERDVVGLLF